MKRLLKKVFNQQLQKLSIDRITTIDDILYQYEMQRNVIRFLQIGANDGISNDPSAEFKSHAKWSGIFVEPQSGPFNLLKKNFASKRYVCVNAAMDNKSGSRPLHKIGFSDSRKANGLSTFSEETMKRFFDTGYAQTVANEIEMTLELSEPDSWKKYVTQEEVTTISFDDLKSINENKEFNVILIDTEGFDAQIIDMISFSPRLDVVLFENAHLGKDDYSRSVQKLKESGFAIKDIKADTIAFRNIYLPVFSSKF